MGTTNLKHNLEKPSKLHTETREQEKASSVPAGNDFCRFEWEGGGHYIYAFMQTSRELPSQRSTRDCSIWITDAVSHMEASYMARTTMILRVSPELTGCRRLCLRVGTSTRDATKAPSIGR